MHPQNRTIGIYLLATLFLTGVALAFYFTGFATRHANAVHGMLYDPAPPGWDITSFSRLTQWRQHGAFVLQAPHDQLFNFCPFAVFIAAWLVGSFSDPPLVLEILIAVCALIASGFLWREISSNRLAVLALVVAVCTSYPFAYLFRRGNIEGFVWVPCVAGIFFFIRKHYFAAALFLALAASVKPFPAMLFLLFLPRRRYREFFAGIGLCLAISIASLAVLGPSIAVAFRENLAGFRTVQDTYVLRYRIAEISADHSLFTLVKHGVRLAAGWPAPETLGPAVRAAYPYYEVLAVAIFIASVLRLRKLPLLNQIFGLSTLMILISPINNDYTLIAIYIPWAMLLVALSRSGPPEIPAHAAAALMISCALLFTTQFYLMFGTWVCLSSVVKIFALLAILFVSVVYELPVESFDEGPALRTNAAGKPLEVCP